DAHRRTRLRPRATGTAAAAEVEAAANGLGSGSVVEAQTPLAARQDGELLALFRLATQDVSDRLTAGAPRWETRSSPHLAEDAPLVRPDLLQDHVSPGVRAHDTPGRIRPRTSPSSTPFDARPRRTSSSPSSRNRSPRKSSIIDPSEPGSEPEIVPEAI